MKRVRLLLLLLVIIIVLPSCCGAAGVDDPVTRKAAKFGSVKVSGTETVARRAIRKSHGKKVNLSAWGLDGALDYVHGMYYMARVKTTYKAKSADSVKSKVKVKKGQKVVILYYPRRNGKAVCRLKNRRTVYIPVKKLKVLYYIYNSSTAYTDAQIEEWVASKHITSKTKYMFVASKFNQYGCIAMRHTDYNFVYWYLPYKTRVVLF